MILEFGRESLNSIHMDVIYDAVLCQGISRKVSFVFFLLDISVFIVLCLCLMQRFSPSPKTISRLQSTSQVKRHSGGSHLGAIPFWDLAGQYIIISGIKTVPRVKGLGFRD